MATASILRLVATAIAAGTCLHASTPPLRVSDRVTGAVQQYVVRRGDTLTAVSARFGVGNDVIATGTGLEPGKALVAGTLLAIDNRHIVPVASDARLAILINIPQRMLFLRRERALAKSYPVAVGKSDWPTPTGPFQVVLKEVHPTWDVPASIQDEMRRAGQRVITRMPPGPRNPLGDYWIGLSLGSLGIHGTPSPSTIYRFATHGCLRMHPDDVEALFADVVVGTRGATVYEPVLLAVTDGGIFLEANRDVYRRGHVSLDEVRSAAATAGLETRIDWTAAAEVLRRRAGVARLVSLD
jgi:L,D-transpeptidase ErfK/SrfK